MGETDQISLQNALIEEPRTQSAELTQSKAQAQSLTALTLSDNRLLRKQVRKERQLQHLYRIGHTVLIQGITNLRKDQELQSTRTQPEEKRH